MRVRQTVERFSSKGDITRWVTSVVVCDDSYDSTLCRPPPTMSPTDNVNKQRSQTKWGFLSKERADHHTSLHQPSCGPSRVWRLDQNCLWWGYCVLSGSQHPVNHEGCYRDKSLKSSNRKSNVTVHHPPHLTAESRQEWIPGSQQGIQSYILTYSSL